VLAGGRIRDRHPGSDPDLSATMRAIRARPALPQLERADGEPRFPARLAAGLAEDEAAFLAANGSPPAGAVAASATA